MSTCPGLWNMEMYYAVDEYEEQYIQNADKNLEGTESSTNLKKFQTYLRVRGISKSVMIEKISIK